MLRATLYIAVGWLLIAVVAGLGHSLGLTVMLPASSVVVLTHMAFSGGAGGELEGEDERPAGIHRPPLAADLAVALTLGYLEDVHQGHLSGTLSLAHGLTFLVLRWASYRIAIDRLGARTVVTLIAAALVDVLTALILILIAPGLGLDRAGFFASARAGLHWHVLATTLAMPAIWVTLEAVFRAVRRLQSVSPRPASPLIRSGGVRSRRPPAMPRRKPSPRRPAPPE